MFNNFAESVLIKSNWAENVVTLLKSSIVNELVNIGYISKTVLNVSLDKQVMHYDLNHKFWQTAFERA